jgi:iron complex outermembrane recepter protein
MKAINLFLVLMLFAINGYSQNVIQGKITDEQGNAVAGASVYEKGTFNGTMSDYNGSFTIRYTQESAIIVISYVGYKTQEIPAAGKSQLDVVLKPGAELKAVEVVGSRRIDRTRTETPVAVDMIDVTRVTNANGQVDINQLLQYSAPSFNSNKQSGADGADHIDPATLRGLGPDQTLVLINGKRRHQSSLVNIYGTRGRGNTGTDLNTIPAAAIERIEILRDGASAQYGSDAIAGVINIVLKSTTQELSGGVSAGMRNAKPPSEYDVLRPESFDGETWQAFANYGVKVGDDGFLNMTMDYTQGEHTNRPVNPEKYEIYRRQFGDAAYQNFGFYFNSSFEAGDNLEVYTFGGFNHRFTDAYAFTRDAGSERNVLSIYPDGFDPKIQSVITDKAATAGIRSKIDQWNLDVSNTFGSNNFHFYGDQTLNASLEEKSPTRFDDGGFSLLQNTTNFNLSRFYDQCLKGFNLAMGAEHRIENYKIFAGEEASYATYGPVVFSTDSIFDDQGIFIGIDTTFRPGGAQGFPGFRPENEVNESRTNIAAYLDGELDLTDYLLVSGAVRYERYSDFGNTFNGKFAARARLHKYVSLRGSVSTGFRAPSLPQLYFNQTFTDVVSGQIIDKIIARNNSPITRALGIPELKQEKSVNVSGGITARFKGFALTIDPYYVKIEDRIVLTGAFDGDNSPEIADDLDEQGVSAVQFFTNAVNTSTVGADIVVSYSFRKDLNNFRISLAGNFNDMKIDEVFTNDKLAGKEDIYFGKREQYFLLASAPKSKVNLTLEYNRSKFNANVRFVQFGKVELVNFADEIDTYDPKMTTDVSVGYELTRNLNLVIGGANIFNVYPDQQDAENSESGGIWDAVQMGFSGAYYFARLGFKF